MKDCHWEDCHWLVQGWYFAQITLPTQNLLLRHCTCTTIWCTSHESFATCFCQKVDCLVNMKDCHWEDCHWVVQGWYFAQITLPTQNLLLRHCTCTTIWCTSHESFATCFCQKVDCLVKVTDCHWEDCHWLVQGWYFAQITLPTQNLLLRHCTYTTIWCTSNESFASCFCQEVDCLVKVTDCHWEDCHWLVQGWFFAQITLPTQNLLLRHCTCTTIWCTSHESFASCFCQEIDCLVNMKDCHWEDCHWLVQGWYFAQITLPTQNLLLRHCTCTTIWCTSHGKFCNVLLSKSWLSCEHDRLSLRRLSLSSARMILCPNHSTNAELAVETLHMHYHLMHLTWKFCIVLLSKSWLSVNMKDCHWEDCHWLVQGWYSAQITLPTQNLLLRHGTCTAIWCLHTALESLRKPSVQVIWTWILCHLKGSVIFSVSLQWNARVTILSRYPLTTEPETPQILVEWLVNR